MSIRLVIADDHDTLREGLRRSMSDHGFDVVGTATNGTEAVRVADDLLPDVVLMDVAMPEMDGIEAAHLITRDHPEIAILMFSVHAEAEVIESAMKAGAKSYKVKDCSTEELADAIRGTTPGEPTGS